MAIDDLPSSQLLVLFDLEDLSRSPDLVRRSCAFLGRVMSGDYVGAAEELGGVHASFGDIRSEQLLRQVVADLKSMDLKVDALSLQLRKYLGTDFIDLYVDADRKSRATRAIQRVQRIGKILVSSIREPIPPPDETEEAMRIAMELTDDDIRVLHAINESAEKFERDFRRSSLSRFQFPSTPPLPVERMFLSLAKLQALGLIMRKQDSSDQSSEWMHGIAEARYAQGGGYVVLEFGKAFLRSVSRGTSG